MAIREERPISMVEVVDLIGDSDGVKNIKTFIKGFNKMKIDKVRAMMGDLRELDLIKLKEGHIVKIVDFMPDSASDLSKVLVDVSLDKEEVNKILDVVRKY